jgi:PKD repeat protein
VRDAAFSWQPTTPAIGQMVTFTGSADGTPPITYTWQLDVGSWKEGAVVTHTYAATGTYVVVMTATNECGQEVVSHTLIVVEVPVCTPVQIVTATADVAACAVDFAAQLYGDTPFTYLWTFGDGVTATLEAPSHVYTASGTYTVTLEVWNCADQGYASHTFPVTVACDVVEFKVFLPLIWK